MGEQQKKPTMLRQKFEVTFTSTFKKVIWAKNKEELEVSLDDSIDIEDNFKDDMAVAGWDTDIKELKEDVPLTLEDETEYVVERGNLVSREGCSFNVVMRSQPKKEQV